MKRCLLGAKTELILKIQNISVTEANRTHIKITNHLC